MSNTSYRLDRAESDAALVAAVAAYSPELATRVKARLALLRLRAVVGRGPQAAQGKIAAWPARRLALAWRRLWGHNG